MKYPNSFQSPTKITEGIAQRGETKNGMTSIPNRERTWLINPFSELSNKGAQIKATATLEQTDGRNAMERKKFLP
jgi:hypothetical protein